MKVIIFCAAGYSSSMIVNGLGKYSKENNLGVSFKAHSSIGVEDILEDGCDLILLSPQIAYKYDEVRAVTNLPILKIPAMDYAMCNCKKIFELINPYL